MTPEASVVVEFFGEGKADIGDEDQPLRPIHGILPILVHAICGKPGRMLARGTRMLHLHERSLSRKVRFAKRLARQRKSAAAVFVVDSEGGPRDWKTKKAELEQGRDAEAAVFPMAVGVAQPCIEAWLLTDANRYSSGFRLGQETRGPAGAREVPRAVSEHAGEPQGSPLPGGWIAQEALSSANGPHRGGHERHGDDSPAVPLGVRAVCGRG